MSGLDPFAPHPVSAVDLAALATALDAPQETAARLELRALHALRAEDVPLAPMVLAGPAIEERFYRLNNLPERLRGLLERIDPSDPDEDDVEEVEPELRALLRSSHLLDEVIDRFYEALAPLPPRLRVRRPGSEGRSAGRGRPALLAYKELWERDWSFDALMARLGAGGGLAPEARPVLIHGEDAPAGEGELAARASRALAAHGLGAVRLHVAGGGVARVAARALDEA